MKILKRWWKKLCVGLAASKGERDITHGKIDKFGGTGMKAAAVVVALPLLIAATSANAQIGHSLGVREGREGGTDYTRSYRDYVFSRDGVHTLLEYLNGGDPYGANAIARAIEHSGVPLEGGASLPGDQVFGGSPIIMGSLSGGGTKCAMPISEY